MTDSSSSEDPRHHSSDNNGAERQQPPTTTATTTLKKKYGPFHRILSPTQSNEVAKLQVESQEIWGRPRQGSDIPQVQAYSGPLPAGEKGIEFEAYIAPERVVHQVKYVGLVQEMELL